MSRSPFDALVDAYDRARPTYPEQLYDALDRLAGPLAGATVLDVGAGTGIASRGLTGRGAHVVAVDLGEQMLRRLVARQRQPAVVADAHALPVARESADLVTYAQAFHWTRPAEAGAEARRVLKPGGALAVWWNDVDAADQPWWQAQQRRLEALNPAYRRGYRTVVDPLAAAGFGRAEHVELRWSRDLSLDDYLVWLHSKSYVAALGEREPEFLAAERDSLSQAFPGGVVHEPFLVRLWVART